MKPTQEWCVAIGIVIFTGGLAAPHVSGQDPAPADTGWEVTVQGVHHPDVNFGLANMYMTNQSCLACHKAGSVAPESAWWDASLLNPTTRYPGIARLGKYLVAPLIDPILRSHLPIGDEDALVVTRFSGEDPGDDSLRQGDVLLSVGDQGVKDFLALREFIESDRKASHSVAIIRGGKKQEIKVAAASMASPPKPFRIGVQVESPGEAMRAQLKLYDNEGLLVTQVVDQSPAGRAGIQVHDILLRANEQRLSDFEGLKNAVNRNEGNPMKLTLMRGGKELVVQATPEQDPQDSVRKTLLWRENCPAAVHTPFSLQPQDIMTAFGIDPLTGLPVMTEKSEAAKKPDQEPKD